MKKMKKIKIISWLVLIIIIIFGGVVYFGYRKPQTVCQYMLGYMGYNKADANAKSEVVFLGDSITARENWNVLFGVSNIFNAGFPGDTTDNILARLDAVVSAKPQKIFLMAGVNDLLDGKDVSYATANYEKILDRIISQSPKTKIYVESILPVNNDILKSETVDNQKIMTLNEKIRLLAESRGMIFINLYPHFSGMDGNLPRIYAWDGLHPNAHGYAVWKDLIEQEVK